MAEEYGRRTPRDKGWLWDYENCPVDRCGGDLQQQDKFNVMCLSCEAIFTHWKDGDCHRLLDKDGETVAKKARMVPDGGLTEFTQTCGRCGLQEKGPWMECSRCGWVPPEGGHDA